MADLFDCHIDELFSRDIKAEICHDLCSEFTWDNDNIIHGVVCLGKKILQVAEGITEKFTFEIIGDTKSVQSECNIMISGSISGGCNAGGEVAVGGHLSGGCNCSSDITVGGHL